MKKNDRFLSYNRGDQIVDEKKNKIIIIIINVMTSICLKKKFRVNIEWSNTFDHMAYLDIYFLFQHLVKRTNTHTQTWQR